MIPTYDKDPNAVVDYSIDWATWLGADTIATSTWTVPTGITTAASSNTTTTATLWLSGGTLGQRYLCTNHVVTAGGREEDQSIMVVMESR